MSAVDALVARARPPWWGRAACRTATGVNFFPVGGQSAKPAKAVCADCPACIDCLDAAMREPWLHGVWGGTTRAERRKMREAA